MTDVPPPDNRVLMRRDRVADHLGFVVTRDEPGLTVISMAVRDDMLNGFDVTHGGVIFSLADTAFAYACNDDEQITLAAGADIAFLKPTSVGDTLRATAALRTQAGRSGIYDVSVTNQDNLVIAEFRGRSRKTTLPLPGSAGK